MKNIVVILMFLVSGLAMAQTTVTLEDQCNCEVLSGTAVTTASMTTPAGADIGDIYVNTNTGTIYFWDGDSWELTSSDSQQLQNFSFNAGTNLLTLTLENGGSVSVDLSALNGIGTDNQALTLDTGNILTLEDGGTVNLTPFLDNTDDQNIENLDLTGNTLTVGIENGAAQTVDLSALVGTDNQNIENLALVGNTLTVGIEDGTSQNVDLSSLVDADDQTITAFSLDNTTNILTITLEDGNTQTVDLSVLNNIGTDDQNISGSVLTGTNLLIGIENGTNEIVDLSGLANTDEQDLNSAVVITNESVELQITNGNNTTIDIRDADADVTNELAITGSGTPTATGTTGSNNGETYVDTTTGQLYVFEGGTWQQVGGSASPDADPDPTNEINTAFNVTGGNLNITDSGGTLSVPLSSIDTDNQDLTLSGTDLSIEDGNTVDLSSFVSTDDQNISGSVLSGTDLTIGIENGTNEVIDLSSLVGTDNQNLTLAGNILTLEDGGTVDLSSYLDNSDDQTITTFSLDNTTYVLTITLEDGNTQTVDLSVFNNAGTDDQNLTLTGDSLEIEDGNNVDLSGYLDNTDDQNIESLGIAGNILTVGIESGTAQTVDLSTLVGTDNQNIENLALAGNTLTVGIEDGTSQNVDLSSLIGTDDQTITAFSLDNTTNILTITLEDGNTQTVDLSSLVGTDDQGLTLIGNTLSLEDGGTVDLSVYLDDTDNQTVTDFDLGAGDILTITLEDGNTQTVDLSSLNDTGTDDQDLSTDGTAGNISIENGNSINLNVDDADSDPGNEYNTAIATNTGNLEITDNGGTLSTALISADANNDLSSGTDGALYLNVSSVTISETITDLTDTNDGSVTYVNENGATQKVAKADITDNGDGTYVFTNNDGTDVLLDTRAASNPYNNTASGLVATDTQTAIDELSAGSTDDQNLTLSGTDLSIEDGNTVDLSGFVSTDDQNISGSALTGTDLTIGIENGTNETVDLSSLVGTDDQNISGSGLTGTDLTIGIENGTNEVVDLSSLVGTDDQDLTLVGNTLTLEDGGTVDLTAYLDNSDDQTVTAFDIDNTTNILTITLENGNTQTVDLSALDNSGTDDQQLTLATNTLTLEDGGNVNLSGYLDNTDDQNIENLGLAGNILTVGIESGTAQTVDLSALNNSGTDNQNLTGAALNGSNVLQIDIEDGSSTTVDLSSLNNPGTDDQDIESLGLTGTTLTVGIEDGTAQTVDLASIDTDTDEQDLTGATLTGNTLQIEIENGASTTVDLSALDNSGTDDQQLNLATNTLTLEDGGTVDLSGYLDNTDEQNIENLGLAGNVLTVGIENGTAQTVDLSALDNAGTDDQNISGSSLTGTDLTIGIENGASQVVDLSSLSNTDDQSIDNLSLNSGVLNLSLEDDGLAPESIGLISTDANNNISAGTDGALYLNVSSVTISETNTTLGFNAASNELTYTNELGNNPVVNLSSLANTDDQNIESLGLIGNILTVGIENGTSQTVDLSALNNSGTDNQNLTGAALNGSNILQIDIEDGNSTTVDLSALDNAGTDDQNISGSGLSGTDLTIGIENGTSQVVDLSILANTDDQNIENLAVDATTNILTVGIEDGTAQTVDLSHLDNQGTDDQQLTLAANTLTLEDGGNVDLSGYLDNTDEQNLTGAALNASNILQIDIENGTSTTVDLSALNNSGTDDQNLTLVGNTLTLEDGGTVDLTAYLDNTDDQTVTAFAIDNVTNELTITLENGNTRTVDLSALDNAGTDDQQLTLATNTLTLEDGGTVDLSGYLDNTDEQNLTLSGTDLSIDDGNTVDLSGFVSTDDQGLTLVGNTLTLEDGGTVDLTAYLDDTDDQTVTAFDIDNVTNVLTITLENGNTRTVDLSGLDDAGTDDQNISGSGLTGTDLTIGIEGGTNEVVDLSSLVGTDDQNLTGATLTGNSLQIDIEGGSSATVDLSALDNAGTDDQNISGSGLTGTDLTIGIEGGTNETVNLSSLVGTDDQIASEVNIMDAGDNFTATEVEGALAELAAGSTDDQNISGSGLTGTDLTIGIEGGTNETVDLSSLAPTIRISRALASRRIFLPSASRTVRPRR